MQTGPIDVLLLLASAAPAQSPPRSNFIFKNLDRNNAPSAQDVRQNIYITKQSVYSRVRDWTYIGFQNSLKTLHFENSIFISVNYFTSLTPRTICNANDIYTKFEIKQHFIPFQ